MPHGLNFSARPPIWCQRRRRCRQRREHVAVPDVDVDGAERDVVLAESRRAVHVRRRDEAAVEAVGPGVIRALDALGEVALRLGAQPGAAMPAHVVEPAEPAAAVARDDDAFAGDLAQHVVAWRRQVLDACDTRPTSRRRSAPARARSAPGRCRRTPAASGGSRSCSHRPLDAVERQGDVALGVRQRQVIPVHRRVVEPGRQQAIVERAAPREVGGPDVARGCDGAVGEVEVDDRAAAEDLERRRPCRDAIAARPSRSSSARRSSASITPGSSRTLSVASPAASAMGVPL